MPQSVDQILRKAKSHLKRGEIELARLMYQEILSKFPKNKRALLALRKLTEDIASSTPQADSDIRELVSKATAKYNQGNFSEAEKLYNSVMQIHSSVPEVLCNLGLIFKERGEFSQAEALMRKAIDTQSDYLAAHHNLAVLLENAGDAQNAEKHYLRVLEINPDIQQTTAALTKLYLRTNNPGKAEQLARAVIRESPDNAVYLSYLGLSLKLQHDYENAIQKFLSAITLQPDEPAHYSNLGNCYSQLRLNADALQCYQKSIEVDPSFIDGYINLASYYETVYKSKRLEDARQILQNALGKGLVSEKLQAKLGSIYLKMGELEQAFRVASQALELNSESADTNLILSEICAELDKPAESLSYSRSALKLQPFNLNAQISHANACIKAHEFTDAIPSLDAYLSDQYSKHAEALALKTIALRELGHHDAASRITDPNRFIYESELGIPEDFDSLESFNSALEQEIKQHPSLEKSPNGFAARNSYLTNDLQTPLFNKFELLLRAKINEYIEQLPQTSAHTFIRDIPQEYFLRIWGTLSTNEGYIDSHIHREGWISAAYYLKLPSSVESESTEGWIEFGKPPTRLSLKAEYPTLRVKPRLGTIIIFPSYYYHRTLPYSSDGERMSISFDLNTRRLREQKK